MIAARPPPARERPPELNSGGLFADMAQLFPVWYTIPEVMPWWRSSSARESPRPTPEATGATPVYGSMNEPASNKMFQPAYRAKWPTAVQALAHLEKCSERVALLIADGLAADHPRLVAARDEAKRASADYSRAEKTDEAMRFQSVNAPLKCLCGSILTPDVIRCPDCNNKRRAG